MRDAWVRRRDTKKIKKREREERECEEKKNPDSAVTGYHRLRSTTPNSDSLARDTFILFSS
jgi:hypothetical protein